ncbi:selenide, water dikinase SelD [Streptomyces vastus]|uniref:Selenide, water dikinase n=2 Tax=Streptomyces vastus TaxID=285451 RepID=A0ABN3QC83_9ACTN
MAKLEGLFSILGSDLHGAAGEDLLIGASEGDDAAVMRIDDERALVLTTDFFTPIVDDPYDWGRVAAANAVSDVYAMGGRPLMALNLTAWPSEDLPLKLLADVLRGGADMASNAGCVVVGGHTIDDPIPKYGLAVVGMADPGRLFAIDKAGVGNQLVLTKPLGTGVIASALKQEKADDSSVAAAITSMTTLNDTAADVAHTAGVTAATDVTGFGLMGHLHRMLAASNVAAHIDADAVPLLPGAIDLVEAGVVPGGTRANLDHLAEHVELSAGLSRPVVTLLHDAQTSGGLLMALPSDDTESLSALRRHGLTAARIGTVVDGPRGHISVTGTSQ